MTNRIVTRDGVWRVDMQRGQRYCVLEGARGVRSGLSGPLNTGMLRTKVILAVRGLLEALYPNEEHHSNRVVPHEIVVIMRKPGAPETESVDLDPSNYARLIAEEPT